MMPCKLYPIFRTAMRPLKYIIAFVLLSVGTLASAAITSGYYRIKSNYYDNRYITENTGENTLVTAAFAADNYAQVWQLSVSGSKVSVRNVLTDRYIQTTSGGYSSQYTTHTSSYNFTLAETNGVYTFTDLWSAGLHCAATQSYNVVMWYTSADASKWLIEAAEVDAASLSAQKAAMAEATTSQLTTFFTNSACTQLRDSYTAMSDDALRSAMSALPASTREMAVRLKNNAWDTYSGWDKTERYFRIADYKPYSNGDRWTKIVGYGNRFGRLSNPTGIYATAGQFIQVYVGSIPSGQTVKLEVAGYGDAAGATYVLHQGMNALLMATSGNCFVFYEVDNTNNGSQPYTPIANYADITVHIEGGTVQGYFDVTQGDDNADWTQLQTHLLTQETVCLKSRTHTFNLNTQLLKNALGSDGKIVEMIEVWTDIADMQDNLSARGDFNAYCNNIYSVTSLPGSGNPHATTYGTYYYEAATDIFNQQQLLSKLGPIWTIAHEQGHNRQQLIKMAGTTEVSNNLFSNAALDWQGHYTARVNGINQTFERWMQGLSWLQRVANDEVSGTWECLHLYTQLYQYFHQAGYDPQFYPNLFRALRQSPMTLKAGTPVPASEDYLKFYQTCCDVSGLDLTEFFEVYGFFILPPEKEALTINSVYTGPYYQRIDDYSTYYIYVNQDMIDAAKAAVRAKNYPHSNIMFIEDRVTAPLATYAGHAEGERRQLSMQDNVTAFGAVGQMGQYTDFGITPSAYTYNVSQRGVVVTVGTGAVGFKVYDSSGKLVGLYNTSTFTLPSGLTNYTIKAAAGDGTDAVVTRDETIVINEFPKTNVWYAFCSTLRGSYYMFSNGVGQGVVGKTASQPTDAMQWRFILRDGETDVFDIVNRNDNSYLAPTADYNTQILTSASQPAQGWKIGAAATDGMYIINSGSVQLNQTNINGTGGKMIYNWGGGNNTSDTGCQFTIVAIETADDPTPTPTLSSTPLAELAGLDLALSPSAANDLVPDQWYVMFDRGADHGYLYERVESHTLYNTATSPSGSATDNCKYLVRLIEAGDVKYYLQTGYGNYFGQIAHKTNVPVIATPSQRITVAKINNTDGHFYLQGETGGVVLDANDLRAGDATVVGWNTTVPASTDGNNDWAFYPVELVDHDIAVGIKEVKREGVISDEYKNVYDLSGRRIQYSPFVIRHPHKGMNIVNRKKVVVK